MPDEPTTAEATCPLCYGNGWINAAGDGMIRVNCPKCLEANIKIKQAVIDGLGGRLLEMEALAEKNKEGYDAIARMAGKYRELKAEIERLRKVYDDIEGRRLMLLDQRDTANRLLEQEHHPCNKTHCKVCEHLKRGSQ